MVGELRQGKIEQIGFHGGRQVAGRIRDPQGGNQRAYTSEAGRSRRFRSRRFPGCPNRGTALRRWIWQNQRGWCWRRPFWSVAPISSRFFSTAPSPSSTCTITGPEIIEADQIVEERALFVHSVKAFGFGAGQVLHLAATTFRPAASKRL